MASSNQYPRRLKRSESFLGVHFDFHAQEDDQGIGGSTTREMIERIILAVKPDYLQRDAKGHPGLSSYPTKVGNPAPGLVADDMRIWRDVTAEHGVGLYVHYSGVWDTEALRHHPEWARVDEEGNGDKNITSVFGPYVDELLIPQLKELSDVYGVDGFWVDGECWATCHDYREGVVRAFREETGIQGIPRAPEDPHFFEFTEFCREGFRRHLRHYVDEMHRHNPELEITSNWSYSTTMPEPVTVDVDYLTGDYDFRNSLNMARLAGRLVARQGTPWELMAWSFSLKDRPETGDFHQIASCAKSLQQLQREAASVISLGGGFSVYFQQKRDGSVREWEMKLMAEVAAFCRARQSICHGAQAVPQIGLLCSTASFYRQATRVFGIWNYEVLAPLRGALLSLLDAQNAVEVLMEHHLLGRMAEYPLIVIPEWEYLEPDFREELLAYVESGGNLLVIGLKAADLFSEELGITIGARLNDRTVAWLGYEGLLVGVNDNSPRAITLREGVQAFGKLYLQHDNAGPYEPAGSITTYGKGKIAAVYLSLGDNYLEGASFVGRDFLNGLVRVLFPEPMVEVTGSHYVDVIVNRIDGRLTVNLVNTAGPHADGNVCAFDDIPAVGPLDVTIRHGTRPESVRLEPGGREIPHGFDDGTITLTLPRLEIHDVIVVE